MGNRVFLTMDDGPSESFEEILDIFNHYRVTATFFLVASKINPENRPIILKALELGHRIGNHSWSHVRFSQLTPGEIIEQIVRAHEVIDAVLRESGAAQDSQERYFRFPYLDPGFKHRSNGETWGNTCNVATAQMVLKKMGYKVVWQDLDSKDWMLMQGRSTIDTVVRNILKVKRGDILMLHDIPSAPDIMKRTLPVLTEKWALTYLK